MDASPPAPLPFPFICLIYEDGLFILKQGILFVYMEHICHLCGVQSVLSTGMTYAFRAIRAQLSNPSKATHFDYAPRLREVSTLLTGDIFADAGKHYATCHNYARYLREL
jgi:hypothetical protein